MKITVLAGNGASTAILLNWLLQKGYTDLDLILEVGQSRFSQLRRRTRRQGLPRTLGQAIFMTMIVPLLRWESAARRCRLLSDKALDHRMPDLPRRLNISDINDEIVGKRLRDRNPDIILVNGTQILRATILSAVSAPYINIHAGITPHYRGVHGGYWALYNDDASRFGVTIHLVDEGVDTGSILDQVFIVPNENDNFTSYPLLQQMAGLDALGRLLEEFSSGGSLKIKAFASGQGRQWSHPTVCEYLMGRISGVR